MQATALCPTDKTRVEKPDPWLKIYDFHSWWALHLNVREAAEGVNEKRKMQEINLNIRMAVYANK